MKMTPSVTATLLLVLCFRAEAGAPAGAGEPVWRLGLTRASVVQVYSEDPAGELERRTTWLDDAQRGLVAEADGEEVACPMYCVIKFTRPGRFRVTATCRADGNGQVIAFSPRSRSFTHRDFRDVTEPRALVLDVDASESPYLVLNCTGGNLYVDALAVEENGAPQRAGDPRFSELNPHYKERAGAFYDIKYVSPSAEALFKIADVRPEQMRQTLSILRAFVDEWLDAYVEGNGTITETRVQACLRRMDARFDDLFDELQRKQYRIWRDDTSGDYNKLRFLMVASGAGTR